MEDIKILCENEEQKLAVLEKMDSLGVRWSNRISAKSFIPTPETVWIYINNDCLGWDEYEYGVDDLSRQVSVESFLRDYPVRSDLTSGYDQSVVYFDEESFLELIT